MKVSFKLEEKPLVSGVIYDKQKLYTYLRDRLMPRLQKHFALKVKNNEITSNEAKDYIVSILNKALESNFSTRELEKIESYFNKFSFLPYAASQNEFGGHTSNKDDFIHQDAFTLIALCVGYKKIIQQITGVLVMNLKYCDYVGWDESQTFCGDIKKVSKIYMQQFLSEFLTNDRIMTSEELAATVTKDEEDNCSNDFLENETSVDAKPQSDNANNQDANQRSISFQESKEENDKASKGKKEVIDIYSVHNLVLQKLLSWIHELPEWLQKQILNSSVVKAVIESIEQNAKIYDKTVDLDICSQGQASYKAAVNEIEDSFDPKVTVSEVLESALVDTNMILDGNYVSGLILPISGEQAINFNGLNFNDFAIF